MRGRVERREKKREWRCFTLYSVVVANSHQFSFIKRAVLPVTHRVIITTKELLQNILELVKFGTFVKILCFY